MEYIATQEEEPYNQWFDPRHSWAHICHENIIVILVYVLLHIFLNINKTNAIVFLFKNMYTMSFRG